MKKRVLVCGASGFIGRNIFERLSQKQDLDVYGIYLYSPSLIHTEPHAKLWRVDLTERDSVRKITKEFDCIIHAAALTDGLGAVKANPGKYIADNIIMNTNIAEAVLLNDIPHLMFMGSSVVYPSKPTPQKEEEADLSLIHPQYFMGARIKTCMEDLCKFYSQHCNTRFTIIRHCNIYGPYDKFNLQKGHVFAATIKKVLSANDGDDVIIWGEGKEERDLLYASDLVDFIETAVTKNFEPRYNIFNISSGTTISVSDLVKKIIEISGKRVGIRYDPSKPSLGNQIILDWQKAYKTFGWQPKVDLNQGIRQTIDWYLKNQGEQSGK
ncbi:MAG: NAD-dependent epimerase/dehydratase family protein [Patescibacteria group bacterium]|mgnify:CR=1 FL=1